MKNAGIVIMCCILSVFAIPVMFMNNGKVNKPVVSDSEITVYISQTDKIEKMPLEEYVWRVVAGEMYYSYNIEALKAQAVAIRTYALKKSDSASDKHKGADICTDHTHCMAFTTDDAAKQKWGNKYEEIASKFKKSAYDTAGEVLEYDNNYATTVFHAISSGVTEKASDVWGGNVPYLTNTDSELDKDADGYKTTVSLSVAEVCEKLEIASDSISSAEIERTAARGVKNVKFGDKVLSGSDIRSRLGLRSAHFEFEQNGDTVTFNVYGYGHGIGMSQAGANAYAESGYDYKQILQKYYPGTTLCTFK